MPIIDVLMVTDPDEPCRDGLALDLANAIGSALGAAPGRVWVRLQALSSACYAENQSPLGREELPLFIQVLHATPPTGSELRTEIALITRAAARVAGRPSERVHIEYAPPGSGRISFGGRLVE